MPSISVLPPMKPPVNKKWWNAETVAVVTGANRGIGYAFAKRLAQHGLTVVMVARDAEKGRTAVARVHQEGGEELRLEFLQLDVADDASIKEFAASIRQMFGAIDILVNNAGVSFNRVGDNSVEHAETVIRTNFLGPKLLIKALLPLFRRSPTSRILNISSRLGTIDKLRDSSLKATFNDAEGRLTEEGIDRQVARFLRHAKAGTWRENGWPELWTDYAVSKLALNTYSRLLSRQYDGRGLSVNCYCPGYTRTDMTGGRGNHTADEAAELGVQLVLLPQEKLPTGRFFKFSELPYNYSKL